MGQTLTVKVKDPFELSPDYTVRKTISTLRCISEFFEETKSINFSGFCTMAAIQFIKENRPEYYEQYKQYFEKDIRRKETTPMPKIKHILIHTNT